MNKKRKLRILAISECSQTASGFGTYYNEVLKRLVETDKYYVGEFASYTTINSPKDTQSKWKIYANAVHQDDPRFAQYNMDYQSQWGKWRFERVCLDFKSDVNFSIRDPWMLEYELSSPFSPFSHRIWMPTTDSAPIKNDWLDLYIEIDSVFTYSDWALDVLKEESGGKINLQCAAPPGVEIDLFKPPANKGQHKASMGLNPNMNIVGTVMRNQKRKLFPDLFRAFKLFLNKCEENGQKELANNTFLYIHTSYPDAGWNLPQLINQHEIGQRLICSYVCQKCQSWFASPFNDIYATCPNCGGTAIMPNVTNGVDRPTLGKIMGCFDFYVQPTIAAGREMPVWEAASCGVPVAVMPHSALNDAIKHIHAFPIRIAKQYLEAETAAERVMVDTEDMARVIYDFFQMPLYKRQQLSFKIRDKIVKQFTWDNTAKIWESYFDNMELTGLQGKWDSPPRIYPIPDKMPPNQSVEDFVTWLYNEVLHQPERRHSYRAYKICSDLTFGLAQDGGGIRQINREMIFNMYRGMAKNRNDWDAVRCGMVKLEPEDYLLNANLHERAIKLKPGDIIR